MKGYAKLRRHHRQKVAREENTASQVTKSGALQFQNVCAAALGLGLDGAVSLTTVRAMQHCGALRLSQNLYFGVGRIAANHYRHGPLSQILFGGDNTVMYKILYWPIAMIFPLFPCTSVQYARKYQLSFGPAGDPERSFEEWVCMVDQIADDVDRQAKFKRPVSSELVGPGSEWRVKEIRGIPCGSYIIPFLARLLKAVGLEAVLKRFGSQVFSGL